MHATRGGWVGQAFALATSNDAGGKKSRIRRSKEERKMMVESFINKYQKSNDGNFPSLNLTHKEVGGSFYTVREIVREIIQENRVLAPPKVSVEEHDHSGFLEQHPLGSISVVPQYDFSVSDELHIGTPILLNQHGLTSEELISGSSLQFLGSDPPELNNERVDNGFNRVPDKEEGLDKAGHSVPDHHKDTSRKNIPNPSQQLAQPKTDTFENEKIVYGSEGLEEIIQSDRSHLTNDVPVYHQDNNNDTALQSTHYASQSHHDEQYLNRNEHIADGRKESEQQVNFESVDMENLDGDRDVDVLQTVISDMDTDVAEETFPLKPVSKSILDSNEEPVNLREAVGTIEDRAKHDNENDGEKLLDSTLNLNREDRDLEMALDLQEPPYGNSKPSRTSEAALLSVGDVMDTESNSSLPSENKASTSTVQLIFKDSSAAGPIYNGRNMNGLTKGNNQMMDRINLKTWESVSKKPARPESNPLLTLVKAFISAFVKFWTK